MTCTSLIRRLVPTVLLVLLMAAAGGCVDDGSKSSTTSKKKSTTTDSDVIVRTTPSTTSSTTESTTTTQTTKTVDTTTTSSGDCGEDCAPASVLPGDSIAGIGVDAPRSEVVDTFGPPDSEKTVTGELGGYIELGWGGRLTVRLDTETSKVIYVETTNPGDKTAGGIGVGSATTKLTASLPSAQCDESDPGICRVGTGDAGSVVTDFFFAKGKITRISLGRVID